jgi:hypothetical protein
MRRKMLLPLIGFALGCGAQDLPSPWGRPIDPAHLTNVAFGSHSHWLQPWRGYLETMPATQFLDGLGIGLNTHRGEDPMQILRMCAASRARCARIWTPD